MWNTCDKIYDRKNKIMYGNNINIYRELFDAHEKSNKCGK